MVGAKVTRFGPWAMIAAVNSTIPRAAKIENTSPWKNMKFAFPVPWTSQSSDINGVTITGIKVPAAIQRRFFMPLTASVCDARREKATQMSMSDKLKS